MANFSNGMTVMPGTQAKVLSPPQVKTALSFIDTTRQPVRNRVIFLLSLRAGLRAKEIAAITWSMVCDAEGDLTDIIRLTDVAAKGKGGGFIPIAKDLRKALLDLQSQTAWFADRQIIETRRRTATSAQVITNLFADWYRRIGFEGCSSHSGRRTFITNAARNIGRFGGSLRDVQILARHSSLTMTQRYIEVDTQAIWKVIDAV